MHFHGFSLFYKGRKLLWLPVCFPWRKKPFLIGVYSYRKEFAPSGANSFLKELTPIEKGSKKENTKVASSESIPVFTLDYAAAIVKCIHLHSFLWFMLNYWGEWLHFQRRQLCHFQCCFPSHWWSTLKRGAHSV